MEANSATMEKIKIEVSLAFRDKQAIVSFETEPGITAQHAIEVCGILEQFPDFKMSSENKLGIFGKLVKPDTVLKTGDRVEIYRPLIADPKEVRRRRAAEGKPTKKGGAD